MRSQEALRPGVAILAAALLALAWIPAAAAPAPTIVEVDERLPAVYVAVYVNVDNPCTAAPETITLQGSFIIKGSVTFYPNGTKDVYLIITPDLRGTDTAGVNYTSTRYMRVGFGRITPKTPLTWTTPFEVDPQADSLLPYFGLKVRFVINPNGNPKVDFVTFNPSNSNGFDGVVCPR